MSSTSNLVAKKVVDVNGRSTTVYVNPSKKGKGGSRRATFPSPSSSAPVADIRINDLIAERARIQSWIMSIYKLEDADREEIDKAVTERNRLESVIRDFSPASRDDGAESIPVTGVVIESSFLSGDERVGFSNDLAEPDVPRNELRKHSTEISSLWLDSLSSASAIALVRYTGYSKEYAVEHAAGAFSPVWEDFEDGVARAPKVEPFVAYTGVNEHYVEGILAQAESGEVVFDRVFSSSLNPAQVNGFANGYGRNDKNEIVKRTTLALEVETTVGACMDVVSNVPHEMEVMLPKGRYEVIEILDDIKYIWGGSSSGRTMDKTLRLRFLGE